MGDNALLVQILTGVLVIFFFVTIGFSVRTWRWAHLVFLSFTFIALMVYAAYASVVLKIHKNWQLAVQKLEKDLVTYKKTNIVLQHGEATEAQQTVPNIRNLKASLDRIQHDRGRVWQSCQPGNFDVAAGSVVVTTAPPAAEGAAAPANRIDANAVIYAFREVASADNTMLLPGTYLGEFSVTAATDTTVTLSPTIPLDGEQLKEIRTGGGKWVLYEIMPIDGYDFFAGMTKEQLEAMMPRGNLAQADYDAIIDSYVRTGGPWKEGDGEGTKFLKVKFLKIKTIEVDSDTMDETLKSNFFDAQGRAIAQRLRRGESVQFKPGDGAIVDPATAQEWKDAGDAEVDEQNPIYMRQLNDYAKDYQNFFHRRETLADKIEFYKSEYASAERSLMLTDGQLKEYADEKVKLEEDKANFTIEQQEITKLEAELQKQVEDLRKQLSETYRVNLQLAAELAALQNRQNEAAVKADDRTASMKK